MSKDHWWHRLSADVQTWLHRHDGEPLPPDIWDAAINAGFVDIHHEPNGPSLPEDEWEYIREQWRASGE